MKFSIHTVPAVACALALLCSAFAPDQAAARNTNPPQTGYSAKNPPDTNSENSGKKGKRASRSADSPNESPTVSRSEAAAIAERSTGGRVLSVRESGRYWRVKVLVDDKRVRYVNVDKRSGKVN